MNTLQNYSTYSNPQSLKTLVFLFWIVLSNNNCKIYQKYFHLNYLDNELAFNGNRKKNGGNFLNF